MVLGSWNPKSTICPFQARKWPSQAPKTLRFKGTMANFEVTNIVKQGKNRQKDKWYTFHACTSTPPPHVIECCRGRHRGGCNFMFLVAPYRAILRYYRCDTPYHAILSQPSQQSPNRVRYPPPLVPFLQRHISAIPHFATYRAILVRYPRKTSTKMFCDTIAESIARYEKYRCWAS